MQSKHTFKKNPNNYTHLLVEEHAYNQQQNKQNDCYSNHCSCRGCDHNHWT